MTTVWKERQIPWLPERCRACCTYAFVLVSCSLRLHVNHLVENDALSLFGIALQFAGSENNRDGLGRYSRFQQRDLVEGGTDSTKFNNWSFLRLLLSVRRLAVLASSIARKDRRASSLSPETRLVSRV